MKVLYRVTIKGENYENIVYVLGNEDYNKAIEKALMVEWFETPCLCAGCEILASDDNNRMVPGIIEINE